MRIRLENFLKGLSLAQRFMLANFVIMIAGMVGIGAWVGQQIETGVIHRTAATTALYVDSFIAPYLQELAQTDTLSPAHVETLNRLLQDTPLGQQIVAFRVWDAEGRVLYSANPANMDRVFPVHDELARSWQGEVTGEISDLQGEENVLERQRWSRLLEVYSPVRLSGTNQIIAVAEFYQTVDDLQREISAAQRRSWLVVGAATLVMYLLLAGFVQRVSDMIIRQQVALSDQVVRLTELLAQNETLHERIRRAAARTTALNERFLRRISAELHDGPAQDVGLALLRLDQVLAHAEAQGSGSLDAHQGYENLNVVQSSLQHALQEVRAISAGLGLPQLDQLTLPETLARVVRVHERRTGTKVSLTYSHLPEQASLPLKITLYRLIQEALNNAYHHAGGVGQQVQVGRAMDYLNIEISDQGPGLPPTNGVQASGGDEHLGLNGMRERVESLGGRFWLESQPGQGTKVIAQLSLQPTEDTYA